MVKNMKKKKFDLFSNDDCISNLLISLKNNSKVYNNLIQAIQFIGKFEGKTEVEIYDVIDTNDKSAIRLCCTDEDGNILIFYIKSSDKKDFLKILKVTNDEQILYDLSLLKKFQLTEENIDFTRTGKIYNFKFGRLITNEYNFYSLFLREDVGY